MGDVLERLGIRGQFKVNFGAIIMLAVCGSAIMGLPFFRFEYYDAYMNTYHLTNTQMGFFGTIIGIFGIFSYLFGGVVADGMSVRKVITFSLMATGAAGLFHLLPLNFWGLVIIYGVWGISTTFAFAPACVKAVRVMAGKDSQGKAYGFYEGFSSVAGAIVAMIALAIFNWGASHAGAQVAAMKYAILFYSLTNIAMGVLAWFLVKDNDSKLRAGNVSFKGIAQVAKHPVVWIIALVGFCNHVNCLSVYYYIPYTTEVLGAAVAFGALMGLFRKWGGFFGDIAGGYLVDVFGTGRLMAVSYAVVLGAQLLMIFVPAVPSNVILVTVLFVTIYIFFSINMSMSWTMMSEGAIPVEYSGTAAGLICMVGAIPETFVTLMAGRIIDTHPGVEGFHMFFYFLAATTACGFVLLLIYNRYLKSVKAKKAASEATELNAKTNNACACHLNIIEDEGESCEPSACTGAEDAVSVKSQMSCACHLNVIDDDEDAEAAAAFAQGIKDLEAQESASCGCADAPACDSGESEAQSVSVKSQMSCKCHLNIIDDDE